MTIERQAQRAVALCMDILNRYRAGEKTAVARATMASEIQTIADWALQSDFEPAQTDEQILRPVEASLLARYGHELGPRLNRQFLAAFEAVGTLDPMSHLEYSTRR